MTAAIRLVNQPVGADVHNHVSDVKALQQLLMAAGIHVPGGDDGGWGKHTATALEQYQKQKGAPVRPHVDPGDDILMKMAMDAKILIPMPGISGITGLLRMHKWFADNQIKYQKGAESGGGNRATYGVDGNKNYAVQTCNGRFERGPIQMDCTTYANLMMSVYLQGHIHSQPYDASCKAYGETSNNHCARERYGFPLVCRQEAQFPVPNVLNFFKTADQINAACKNSPTRLFALEVGGGLAGGVSHMALYLGGDVYECTNHQPTAACIKRSLPIFASNKVGKIFYLFGPR